MDKRPDMVHDELLQKSKEIKSYLKRQSSIKGTCHEDILRAALMQFVPQNYSMANGILWYNGEGSKQIDIIIYDNTKAKLVTLVPGIIAIKPEAVNVAIEVKATIRDRGIKNTLKNVESAATVYRLDPSTSDRMLTTMLVGFNTKRVESVKKICVDRGIKYYALSKNGKKLDGEFSALVFDMMNALEV